MNGWVRLWHDMPTDPKWRTIARKSGQRVGDVIAVFAFLLVSASENAMERGKVVNFDCEDVASALDLSDSDVMSILDAMRGKVIDDDDYLTGWEKRQPKREDSGASQRKAAWKERQRNAVERIGTHGNAPDTDTDTDTDTDKKITRSKPAFDFACPDGVDPVDWSGLMANRKSKRAPNTEAAYRGIIAKLNKYNDEGWPPGPLVAQAAERGWTTVFETEEMKEAKNGARVGSKNTSYSNRPSGWLG